MWVNWLICAWWYAIKKKGLEIYDFDFELCYNQLSKYFREMHVAAFGAFKKKSLQTKIILKHERELYTLDSALEILKEAYASLVRKQLCVSKNLEKNVVNMKCDICPTLKIKNQNQKGKLEYAI